MYRVRRKAEWAENGTLGNAAVDSVAGRLAARVSIDLSPIGQVRFEPVEGFSAQNRR